MTQDDFEKFEDMLSGVGEVYGKELSEFALAIWWEALKGYDLTAMRNALSRYVTNPDNGQFMPKPADVVRMMGGTTTDRALLAWEKVDRTVRQVGVYKDVVFDDALIHRVLQDMGGWIRLGDKKESEWPFVAKEFETRYRGYALRGLAPEYPAVLTGIANAHNRREGFKCDEPVLMGDPEKAKQVIALGGDGKKLVTRVTEQGFSNTENLGVTGAKVRALLANKRDICPAALHDRVAA
ncbi:MAG: DUF6475 domain-containing protein [Alistipes senegalensis]|nr:DUF6475 domain-containing protein [Oxalobacter formigenes]MCM1280927.1 DUF6475 domain-containing protein [Alistipes senegalensis]